MSAQQPAGTGPPAGTGQPARTEPPAGTGQPAGQPTGRDREQLAARVAADLEDGWCVNLGVGLPLGVVHHLPPDREIMLHAEHGLVGIGAAAAAGTQDPDLTDAGGNHVTLAPGASAFDSSTSFAIIRGGHLDVAVLGGLQVSRGGDLANWWVPGSGRVAVGGAMDLVSGARRVWVVMTHTDRKGRPKLVNECAFPLTGAGVVDRVYTDLAVFDVTREGMALVECADGVTVDDVARFTEPHFEVRM
jgi:3-oxoacid CoA-transferase B subunit